MLRDAGTRVLPWVLGAAIVGIGAFASIRSPIGAGVLVAVVAIALAVFASRFPSFAVASAITVGVTSGFSRRVLTYFFPESQLVDLVVLIPAVVILATMLFHLSRSTIDSPPTPVFFRILIVGIVLAGFNPSGAGLGANLLTSAQLGIWVAVFLLSYRGLVKFVSVARAVLLVGVLNALYMFWQNSFGLTPWDDLWVRTDGYAALYVGPDLVRPLGLASSAAESAALCAVVVAVGLGHLRDSRAPFRALYVVPVMIGFSGALIAGTRTFLLLTIAAACVWIAARSRHPVRNILLSVAAVVPLAAFIASRFLGSASNGVARTLNTLSGQEDLATSTIPLHIDLLVNGVLHGLTTVIGTGSGQLGVLTGTSGNAEVDIANAATMAGVVGLAAIVFAYVYLARNFSRVVSMGGLGLTALLVLVTTFGQWLSVGFYGLTCFVWFVFGALAREIQKAKTDGALDSSGQRRPRRDSRGLEPVRQRLG